MNVDFKFAASIDDSDGKPHKYQEQILNDAHRYQVIVAGRRFGKSILSRGKVILEALTNPGLYWIINPTYRQGKTIHWTKLKKEVPEELITYKNESELILELKNGARIEIKGADNKDSLRGVGLKGVVFDETAEQNASTWFEVIRPTLIDSEGWAMFIGTPKGFNWFYDLYLRGLEDTATKDPEWKSWHFTSYDNPKLKGKEIDKAKNETDDDTFTQEYLAEFVKFKGLIYSDFDRDVHVIKPIEIQDHWEIIGGVDFGWNNPTAYVFIAISDNDTWYIVHEYYETEQSSRYHCGNVRSTAYSLGLRNWASYGDPSATQEMDEWALEGVPVSAARKDMGTNMTNWVGHGIGLVKKRLKVDSITKKPKLLVFNNCENTIKEFMSYRWKEDKNMEGKPDRPEKVNDHLMDALRYAVVSHMRRSNLEEFPTEDLFNHEGFY